MSQPSDPTSLQLSPEYQHALAHYEGLSLQLGDLDGVLEDLNDSLNEAVNAQAQAEAWAAVQQPGGVGDDLKDRVLSLRDDVNRTEEIIAKLIELMKAKGGLNTGGPDVVDGMAVQAQKEAIPGRRQIPTRRAPQITSTRDQAQRLRAQQTRPQPGRGFER